MQTPSMRASVASEPPRASLVLDSPGKRQATPIERCYAQERRSLKAMKLEGD
jgi:hypothetical protein